MNGFRFQPCIALAVVLAATTVATAADHTKDSLATVKKNVEEEKAVLVDVRSAAEWKKGHVEDAVFLPVTKLQSGVDAEYLARRLPKDKIVYTHCVVGKRAATAADILEKHGYEVRPLKPGYKELIKAGFKKGKD